MISIIITRCGSRNLSKPKTKLSLAKVNYFQLSHFATKNSLPGAVGILDATPINSVQKS